MRTVRLVVRGHRVARRHGIALLMTIMAIALVAMLVGAFVSSQQSHLALAQRTQEKQACIDAASSLAEMCRFRLEASQSWARRYDSDDPTVTFRDSDGQIVIELRAVPSGDATGQPEFEGLEGPVFFEGEMPKSAVTFQIAVLNNLGSDSASPGDEVAPRACRLRIRTNRGRSSQTIEVLLRRAAFFDSTVIASGDIELDGDGVNFSSVDPLRNQIRSKSDILLPEIDKIKFTPPNDFRTAEKGTIWATGDISIDNDTTEAMLAQAAETTGGEFLPNAPSHYSVPKLKKSDMDNRGGKPILELDPVSYVFGTASVAYLDTEGEEHSRVIPVLEVRSPVDSPAGGPLMGFHFLEDSLDGEPLTEDESEHTPDLSTVKIELGSGQGAVGGTAQAENGFALEGGLEFSIGQSTDGGGTGSVALRADVDYEVRGSFKIGSRGSVPPQVSFVDPNPDPDHPKEGSLSVDLDLLIQGDLINCGKLLAGRDVELIPKDVKMDKLEEGNSVAVFAGRNVLIRPLFNNNAGFLQDDHRVFSFRGLVYAESDFEFLSTVNRGPDQVAEYHRDLYIEGALVARQGDVLVQGNEKIELKYNPKYLDDLLKQSDDEDYVQIEQLSWRPL